MASGEIAKQKHLEYDGIMYPSFSTKSWIEELFTKFKPRDSDLFVVSFPKSGTTWVQTIVHILHTKQLLTDYLDKIQHFLIVPLLSTRQEQEKLGLSADISLRHEIEEKPDPRIFKSHLQYGLIPKNDKAKYIYVYRNPKDVSVSYYHHIIGFKMSYEYDRPFDEWFDNYFIKGLTEFGSWWECVQGWLSQRHKPNILIIQYEKLILNFHSELERLAKFLNIDLTEDVISLISKASSFDSMKTNQFVNNSQRRPENLPFIRKGKIGDWKNFLSKEQSGKLDLLLQEKVIDKSLVDSLIYDYPE